MASDMEIAFGLCSDASVEGSYRTSSLRRRIAEIFERTSSPSVPDAAKDEIMALVQTAFNDGKTLAARS